MYMTIVFFPVLILFHVFSLLNAFEIWEEITGAQVQNEFPT